MSKIICDICGTVYQDTAESCPICGYTRNLGMEELDEDLLADMPGSRGKGGRFSSSNVKKKNKEIFDYDEVNPEEPEEEEEEYSYDDSEPYEEEPKSNTLLIVVLVVIITLLLVASGFLFFRYFLPNALSDETPPTTLETTVETQEETTEPTVPCTDIVLTSGGKIELYNIGYFHLLHVKVVPEDTTDILTFLSEDESIATVSEDGKITAVGVGETTIYITCGEKQIKCPVSVVIVEETEPATEATVASSADGEAITEGETVSGDEASDVAETEEVTLPEETALKDVVLKLKYTDRSLTVGYGFQLELDCDLTPEEVEWSVEHSYIATVDEKGFVKAVKTGTTEVTAKYGDQEVKCTIRCR